VSLEAGLLGAVGPSCLHLVRPGERPLPYHGAALARHIHLSIGDDNTAREGAGLGALTHADRGRAEGHLSEQGGRQPPVRTPTSKSDSERRSR
jgi:hypothetical protein